MEKEERIRQEMAERVTPHTALLLVLFFSSSFGFLKTPTITSVILFQRETSRSINGSSGDS